MQDAGAGVNGRRGSDGPGEVRPASRGKQAAAEPWGRKGLDLAFAPGTRVWS